MKILMLNYEFPPMGGGAGNATDNISKEMAQMGHKVTVLTSGYGNFPKFELKNGVKIYRVFSWRKGLHDCGMRGAYTYLFFAALKLWSLKKTHEFDILHYFFSLPTGLLSLTPWGFKNIPYIVSLRGSDVPYYDIYSRKVHFFSLLLKPINRYIWKNAKSVVALSKSLKVTALKSSPKQPIEVLPNGVETELFKQNSKKNQNSEKFKLITVSRLLKRKGIDHVLVALFELRDKNINLCIIGSGGHERYLKQLCKDLGLNGIVDFYGYCPREKLPQLYNEADVFILPSLAESFGLVFAEAMACGLPVISTKVGGIVELVESKNGILVEQGNIKQLKDAILKMKQSSELRRAMGKSNRKKVMQHYSWKNVAQGYLSTYRLAKNR